jgi:hypothetical protein
MTTTAFEVDAIFRIINRASPTITAILRQIRELNLAVDKARANLATISKTPGLVTATGETEALAAAWKGVATEARLANNAMRNASRAALPGSVATAGAAGGGGGRARLGGYLASGGRGPHVRGPGMGLTGGGHISGGGAGMAAAGVAGYGVYEAAKMEDAVFHLMYHAGVEYNDANRAKFRTILQGGMRSGYGLHEIAESATQAVRMFQGVPGNGVEVLPELLKAATTEARLKNTSPKESMDALIGLAHMTKEYDPASIKKLAKDFAFLSIATPGSLSSIERGASYSVPILQSGLEIDPMSTLLLGSALVRAGAKNTKQGTWLRAMVERAMPGTAIFESEKKAEHHDELLKRIGLLDKDGHVTWKDAHGKLDPMRMLEIAGEGLKKIPLEERAGVEHKLFGTQGEGAMSLLTDPAVAAQIKELRRMMNSPEWANRYGGFSQDYESNSTVQQARTAMAEFNIALMDIAKNALPAVKGALDDFKGAMKWIQSMIPGGKTPGVADTVLKRGLEGMAAGAAAGAVIGPLGIAGGAVAGGVTGVATGFMEGYSKAQGEKQDKKETADFANALRAAGEGGKAPEVKVQPFSVSLILDSHVLAQAMTSAMASPFGFATQAPAADGMGQYFGGDHQSTDK